jgi:hypothetical protein
LEDHLNLTGLHSRPDLALFILIREREEKNTKEERRRGGRRRRRRRSSFRA